MIKVERFEVGKDTTIVPINRFLQRTGLRRANILSTNTVTLGRDRSILVVTYDDTNAPFVVTSFPGQGSSNVSLGTTAVFVFSEPIQPPTGADVEIFDITEDVVVSSSLYTLDTSDSGDESGGVLRITDSGNYLEGSHIYRITLQSTIRDESGTRMDEDFVLTFSTVADPATTIDPDVPAAQIVTMTSGNRNRVVTTLRKYTSKPVIGVTTERERVYSSTVDGSFVKNPNSTWNFEVAVSHIAPAAGQLIHITEQKQS